MLFGEFLWNVAEIVYTCIWLKILEKKKKKERVYLLKYSLLLMSYFPLKK